MNSSPLRILIVDDSANLRQVIRRYLDAGAKAHPGKLERTLQFLEAGNGLDAEAVLQEQNILDEPIDLIILDWMMPKMPGVEFLKKIRETEIFKHMPRVVMLTAETYPEQMHACIKYGVNAYITKPFTQEDIVQVVLDLFGKEELSHAV